MLGHRVAHPTPALVPGGGSATSTFTVTPGQTISATVGCEGGNGENAPAPKVDPSAGWSSGGGAGRGHRATGGGAASGGGGASSGVCIGDTCDSSAVASTLVVAGGGGGGGMSTCAFQNGGIGGAGGNAGSTAAGGGSGPSGADGGVGSKTGIGPTPRWRCRWRQHQLDSWPERRVEP